MGNLFLGGVILGENGSPVSPPADRGLLTTQDVGGKTEPHYVDSAGAASRVFRDAYFVGQNTTGGTLAKGTVVRATSLVGSDIPIIAAADADASSTMPAAGILMESVSNNGYGRVMFQGVLTGLNTSGMAAGSPLYVSGTAGAFTQTEPVYPAYRQVLGSVLLANASTGVVLVNVSHFFRRVGTPVPLVFFEGGSLTATRTGVGQLPITPELAGTIVSLRIRVATASSSGSVTLSWKKNNAAAFATVSATATNNGGSTTGLSTAVADGDFISVDLSAFGTGASDVTGVATLMTAA